MWALTMANSDLVSQAKAGSLEAFDELVSLHQARVFALAFRMMGNADDAADIQQEAFVRAWRSIGAFRGQSEFTTWLHRITVNLCLSTRRNPDCRTQCGFDEDTLGHSASAQPMCAERIVTGVAVRAAIASLPAHHRLLIVLREIEQRPFDEIARLLDCSNASARTRAMRARAALRHKLRPYLAEEVQ